jgi:hypothetical protein
MSGRIPKCPRGPRFTQAEPGQDFIKDEGRAILVTFVAQVPEELPVRCHVPLNGDGDHCGKLVAELVEDPVNSLAIAVGNLVDVIVQDLRDAGLGPGEGEPVRVTVIADREEMIASGAAAGKPQATGVRVRTGLHKADLLRPADGVEDRLGGLHLDRAGHAEEDAVFHLAADSLVDGRILVTEDDRAEGSPVIDVLAVIKIPHAAALGPLDKLRPMGYAVAVDAFGVGLSPPRNGTQGTFE